jgi:hypothetical protein
MDQTRPIICVLDDEPQFGKALALLLKTHAREEFVAAWASRLSNCVLPGSAHADY